MPEELDMARRVVEDNGRPTSYLEDIVYQLANETVLVENPPSSASDDGVKGTVTFDSNFLYICVDEDTWRRVGISSW